MNAVVELRGNRTDFRSRAGCIDDCEFPAERNERFGHALAQLFHDLVAVPFLTVERAARDLHEPHLCAFVCRVDVGDVLRDAEDARRPAVFAAFDAAASAQHPHRVVHAHDAVLELKRFAGGE